jgi:hypothetical protein
VCNRYVSPAAADLEGMWSLKKPNFEWARQQVSPKKNGLFLRASAEPGYQRTRCRPVGLDSVVLKNPQDHLQHEQLQMEWWSFKRANKNPWALAGLWNAWTDHATGEVVESYTMLTINADHHPIMKRMHKPDPKLKPEEQDKRSVVVIEDADIPAWLHGSQAEAGGLVKLADQTIFTAAPELPAPFNPNIT